VVPGLYQGLSQRLARSLIYEELDEWKRVAERLAQGEEPACMGVCPIRCIHFGEGKSIAAVFEAA